TVLLVLASLSMIIWVHFSKLTIIVWAFLGTMGSFFTIGTRMSGTWLALRAYFTATACRLTKVVVSSSATSWMESIIWAFSRTVLEIWSNEDESLLENLT